MNLPRPKCRPAWYQTALALLAALAVQALAQTAGPGEVKTSAPEESNPRARQLIQALDLQPLPRESGYLAIIGVSSQRVTAGTRTLAAQSQNYYLLTRDRPINYLHWLASDDTHILVEGGPVDYFIFHPDGRAEKITLGMDLANGERPIVAVPGGCWKALRLRDGAAYALMVNALSPEFTRDGRVKIGAGADWVRRYINAAPWATPETLREFIGPNWLP
jgi:predicted cupin superfamily sugar epimerase